MKKSVLTAAFMILIAAEAFFPAHKSRAYASEKAAEDISEAEDPDIPESVYESYEMTDEDVSEIAKELGESMLRQKDGASTGSGYRRVDNPELKVSYDAENGFFVYEMPNGGGFMINVPLGGITDEPVELRADEDTWIEDFLGNGRSCLKDAGNIVSAEGGTDSVSDDEITGARAENTGCYDFILKSGSVDRSGITLCNTIGGFRIARSDLPVWINRITAPCGYEIGEVISRGRRTEVSGSFYELKSDGAYEVIFSPLIQGLPQWTSRFTRDTTAPVLIFNRPLTEEASDIPVSFHPSEPGASVRVYLNNKEVTLNNMTAYADGNYRVIVRDSAGNENEYSFRVDLKEKTPVNMYIYLVLFLTAAAAAVIVTAHGKMRII